MSRRYWQSEPGDHIRTVVACRPPPLLDREKGDEELELRTICRGLDPGRDGVIPLPRSERN